MMWTTVTMRWSAFRDLFENHVHNFTLKPVAFQAPNVSPFS